MKTKPEITFARYASPIGELLLVGVPREVHASREVDAPREVHASRKTHASREPDEAHEPGDGDSKVALRGIYFADAPHAEGVLPEGAREDRASFAPVVAQLDAYFSGKRTSFELELAPEGTSFQREVWRALAAIPYGTTTTYSDIARSIGRPNAVRAVGAANGRNPLSIVVPCHRVVGRDGTLTGYAGGLAHKASLLALERRPR